MKHTFTLLAALLLVPLAALAAQNDMTVHPKIERLAFRAPGRVLMLRDGRFACVSNGKYLVSADEGKNWQSLSEIAPGPGTL